MKNIVFIIALISFRVFSQSNNSLLAPPVEIFLISQSSEFPNGTTTFIMVAESQVWGGTNPNGTYTGSYTWLTDNYNFMTHSANNNQINNSSNSGFNFIVIPDDETPNYGYGKYKLSVGPYYFFLDYRDDYYSYYSP